MNADSKGHARISFSGETDGRKVQPNIVWMSALGQSQTFDDIRIPSVKPPIADSCPTSREVRSAISRHATNKNAFTISERRYSLWRDTAGRQAANKHIGIGSMQRCCPNRICGMTG
jgi:hypothetical protein